MNSVAICPYCYQPIKDYVFSPKTDAAGQQIGDEFTNKCPSCLSHVSDPFEIDVAQEVIWVSDQKEMPDVCVTCGMFSDRRVKVTAIGQAYHETSESIATLPQLLGCLIGLFLGPLSALLTHWLFSDEKKGGGPKDIKVTAKVPQCILCSGQSKAKALAATAEPKQVLIPAHHAFVDKWTELHGSPKVVNSFLEDN